MYPATWPGVDDHSRTVIRSAQTPAGAYPASEAFPAYRGYCWFRDGSFIADAMSAAGEPDSATAFFDWCAGVVGRRASQIDRIVAAAAAGTPVPDEAMLPARYRFDGTDGADDWWDFQLDGYGTWLWAVAAHAARHGLDLTRWGSAIASTVAYLVSSWDRPCYDWWEEFPGQQHVSTLGCVVAGLDAVRDSGVLPDDLARAAGEAALDIAARIRTDGVVDGHLVKWIGSDAVDASLTALVGLLGVIDPRSELGRGTVAAVEAGLLADGGVYRYRGDTFYGGGRWPLLTCFLGLARLAAGDRDGAMAALTWALGTAQGYDLPEQVDGHLQAPEARPGWLDRWGPVASPLLWSHAMVLRLGAGLGLATGVRP